MKVGANILDQRRIKVLYAQGKNAEQISALLRINVDVIERFSPEHVERVNQAKQAAQRAEVEAKMAEVEANKATAEILKQVVQDAKTKVEASKEQETPDEEPETPKKSPPKKKAKEK